MRVELPKRKRNRLEHHDYSSGGAYFITVCTKDKQCILWQKEQPSFVGEDIILPPDKVRLTDKGEIVKEAVLSISTHYPHIDLLQYAIMPNHIHMILLIGEHGGRMISAPTVSTVVGQMKRHASKRAGETLWQKSFHDHVIRDQRDYDEIARYIHENPARWREDCFYCED